jgi:hypothetical protein
LNDYGNAAAITMHCGIYHNWGPFPHIHRHVPLKVSGSRIKEGFMSNKRKRRLLMIFDSSIIFDGCAIENIFYDCDEENNGKARFELSYR